MTPERKDFKPTTTVSEEIPNKFKPLYTMGSTRALQEASSMIKDSQPEEQLKLLQEPAFVNICLSAITNADQRRINAARGVVDSFDDNLKDAAKLIIVPINIDINLL